ncbi:hypothetical protein ACTWPT_44600 [Nonomuraea sp. 3N208]|uniref:hypothetical protein n=1 Tax=Nonomuraea sp. 3N208 TaxID=3457421 RepID=UPI003FD244AF
MEVNMSLSEVLYTHGAIKRKARAICDVADDLRISRRDWKEVLETPEDEFKLTDPAAAVVAVRDVWEKEIGVYIEVLEQWCLATHASAQGFKSVDDYIAARKPYASGGGT